MKRRFRGRCLVCPWISELHAGPVFAGRSILRHVRENHPSANGLVGFIEKRG